jgi:hypothetical protein
MDALNKIKEKLLKMETIRGKHYEQDTPFSCERVIEMADLMNKMVEQAKRIAHKNNITYNANTLPRYERYGRSFTKGNADWF